MNATRALPTTSAICAMLFVLGASRPAAAEEVYAGSVTGGTNSLENLSPNWATIKEGDLQVPSRRPTHIKVIARAWYEGPDNSDRNKFRIALRRTPGSNYYTGPWDATSSVVTLTETPTYYTMFVELPYPAGTRFILDSQGHTLNQSYNPQGQNHVIYNTELHFYWVYPD